MALASLLLGILERPTLREVLLDLIIVAFPLWIAVIVGVVIGWSWKPKWANFTWKLCIPSFVSIPGFSSLKPQLAAFVPLNPCNGLEEQTSLEKPNSSFYQLKGSSKTTQGKSTMEDIGSRIATEDYQSSSEDSESHIVMEEYPSSMKDSGSIIAMKGHPFTRKTEIAKTVAASLGCPVLSYEHFLAQLHPPLSPERDKEVFRIICRMAFDQLIAGMSVVIDSPLSSAWHLEQLTEIAEISYSLYDKKVRVIIIECKPTNAYSWSLRFEEHIGVRASSFKHIERFRNWADEEMAIEINPDYDQKSILHPELVSTMVSDPNFLNFFFLNLHTKRMVEAFKNIIRTSQFERIPWYKPKKWEDVEKAIQISPADYDEKSVQGHEFVSKLVIDPLFLSSSDKRIAEAVKYMMTRDEGDGPDVVLFHQWRQLQSSSSSCTNLDCSKDGHNIVSKSTAEEGPSVDCAFCEKQVMMSDYYYYYCKGCSLALHKDCAESSARKRTKDGKYACRTCKGKGKDFSDHCGTCIVETHLSTRHRPTVISHVDTEEHLLTDMVLSKKIHERNHCVACRKGYPDLSRILCNICGLTYHYECATLPRRVNHEHGLHHHHLSLKFTSEEAEDYLCNECNQLRDPALWFYSCEECPYELHLSCVRQEKVYRSDSSVPDYNFNWESYRITLEDEF